MAAAPYDSRAWIYDGLVSSRAYNRLAWSCSPQDYRNFAQQAVASADDHVLEVAAGSAAATAVVHAESSRPTVLVDLSRLMLERAARRLSAAAGDAQAARDRIRLVQADMYALPFPSHSFTTVLALGVAHLVDDLPTLVDALLHQVAPNGQLHIAGLVAETRRGRHYLGLLHRAGETAVPRTAEATWSALGRPSDFHVAGCMAYGVLPVPSSPGHGDT